MIWRTVIDLLSNAALRGTMMVQGLGSAASLALGLLIAAVQGPGAQGQYGVVRTTADLLLSATLLGLPQGVVHLLNVRHARPQNLYAALGRYVGLVATLGVVAALVFDFGAWSSWQPLDRRAPLANLALAIGVIGWTTHGLQRSFVLCQGGTSDFSWITAAPALTLLVAVSMLVGLGSHRYEWAIATSGVASALWGRRLMRPLRASPRWLEGQDVPWLALWSSGGHATAQTVALALQPWLALWMLRGLGAQPDELGWFVFASYIQQLFALPANFVVPILLARSSRAAGFGQVYEASRSVLAVVALTAAASVVVALALPVALPLVLGEAYRPAVLSCICMALSGPAVMLGRLLGSTMSGRGHFATVTMLTLLRVLVFALGLQVLSGAVSPAGPIPDLASAASVAWALAEVLAAVCIWIADRQARKTQSIS